jgi:hypothetical protein
LANGTRVTTTPTKLGEYRSRVRTSSSATLSDTNGSPAITPSTTDGIALYKGYAWGTADTNNQPTSYDIFVGKNKNVKLVTYLNAGRTGIIDIDPWVYSTNTDIGYISGYDPSTGVFSLFSNIFQYSARTTHYAGIQGDGNGFTSTGAFYFDIVVSENALAVGADQVRSQIYLTGYNGYGATNTKILRFDTAQETVGNAIEYTDSASLGASFSIKEDGVYSVFISGQVTGTANWMGISVNSPSLTTSIDGVSYANGNRGMGYAEANVAVNLSRTLILKAGDILRFHTSGTATFDSPYTQASITKVSN